MTDQIKTSSCAEVEEHMAEILDGMADDRLLDHIAECDRCRDARYEAEQLKDRVVAAGADYVVPADLEARVLARAAQPSATEGPVSGDTRAPTTARMGTVSEPGAEATPPAAAPAEPEPGKTEPAAPATPEAAVAPTAAMPVQTEAMPEKAPIAPEPLRAEQVVERPRRVVPPTNLKPWLIGGGLGAATLAAAAAALIIVKVTSSGDPKSASVEDGWHGNVAALSGPGLSVCAPDGESCTAATASGAVPAGSVLVTDGQTRARLTLADGTELSMERGTRVALGGKKGRHAKLQGGSVVLDVAHIEGDKARIELPRGYVEVLGTKLAVTASDDSATVDVSRGAVKLVDEKGREVTIRAGEEGRAYAGVAPYVTSAPALGEAIAWSESAITEGDREEVAVRGLGELKAKKPGDSHERDGAVTLTSHAVKVRIAGAMARTEVDEVFTNNTSDVLEGIYRFPIPPDAKIERLALEVDGKLEEGAFVDRDRAAAIWRGAIVNAAPQQRREIREEIVWVPGPWRDPALLEWQRGGRFELRIYPIPKNGSRRVILAYTQMIKPTGGVRRFNYPLAHDPSGSTKIGRFDVDLQVRGHDEAFGVRSQGYPLTKGKAAGADELKMSASNFVPAGDLTVEYALPGRDAEVTAWAYKPTVDEKKLQVAKVAAKAKDTTETSAVAEKLGEDATYVALALRPKLPRSREGGQRNFALVVDSSRSMFGESYKRATAVAVKLVRELDRNDTFTVLACDTECRAMPGGMQAPSGQSAVETKGFLDSIVPEGASDPAAAVRAARSAASSVGSSDLRIVFIGDGTPTVGAIRPAYVTRAVQDAVPPGTGTVTTVAVGADSDADTLGAMARGGGGVMLPFVPGQTTAEAVFAVLGATYGSTLRDVTVELPAGLTEVAPKQVDTIIAGGEELLVARMDKTELEGTVTVRGKLGKEGFEQRYPVRIVASESKGNAFVPRVFAASRIADLERDPGADAKKEAIRLSSAFDVASRFTSLLVLESEAMFKAFGLDNTRTKHQWTGEETADATSARGESDVNEAEEDAYGGGDKGRAAPAKKSMGPMGLSADSESSPGFASGGHAPMAKAPPAPAATSAPAEEKMKKEVAADEPAQPRASRRPPMNPWDSGRGRRMVPMRRIWERKGVVMEGRVTPVNATPTAIANAEREVTADGNRREAVRKLYTLFALSGDIEQARGVAERWSQKEPLDPDALTARADLAARNGDRDGAIRILGSVVDVRPDDIPSQKRLARLHRWAGRPALGCRHSLGLAQLRSGDASLLAEAVSCGRRNGEGRMADEMLNAAEERVRRAAETQISKFDAVKDALSGDLRLEASWTSAGEDVDLALIDPDGNRVSWLGAPTKAVISASDVTSTSREGLALRGAKPGEYVIEVVRGSGAGPVRGDIVVNVAGTRRTIPFFLNDARQTVGIAKIHMQSRLVPVSGGWGGWE